MADRTIHVTAADLQNLKTLLRSQWVDREADGDSLKRLEDELERARIVRPTEMPRDIVTMNSRVRVRDSRSGDAEVFSLVYPDFQLAAGSDHLADRTVSVLSPMGMAILGCRVGESVDWETPGGVRSLKVEDVLFQPEDAGRYEL